MVGRKAPACAVATCSLEHRSCFRSRSPPTRFIDAAVQKRRAAIASKGVVAATCRAQVAAGGCHKMIPGALTRSCGHKTGKYRRVSSHRRSGAEPVKRHRRVASDDLPTNAAVVVAVEACFGPTGLRVEPRFDERKAGPVRRPLASAREDQVRALRQRRLQRPTAVIGSSVRPSSPMKAWYACVGKTRRRAWPPVFSARKRRGVSENDSA